MENRETSKLMRMKRLKEKVDEIVKKVYGESLKKPKKAIISSYGIVLI